VGFAQGYFLMSDADGETQSECLHVHHRAEHCDEACHWVTRQKILNAQGSHAPVNLCDQRDPKYGFNFYPETGDRFRADPKQSSTHHDGGNQAERKNQYIRHEEYELISIISILGKAEKFRRAQIVRHISAQLCNPITRED
jgi:hypothetical protein